MLSSKKIKTTHQDKTVNSQVNESICVRLTPLKWR